MLNRIPVLQCSALSALASIELSANCPKAALSAAERAVDIVDQQGNSATGEALGRLNLALATMQMGNPVEARRVLGIAKARLIERANKISDAALRECFLTKVPEHAATLKLNYESN